MPDGEFTVVMSDLQAAASAFGAESVKLRGLIPADGPACPDGGGGDIDAAMHAVLGSIGALNQALAGTMAAHGRKLAQARANYSHADMTSAQLCHDLVAALMTSGQQR
jgi:Family of unknown function (DUF6317)